MWDAWDLGFEMMGLLQMLCAGQVRLNKTWNARRDVRDAGYFHVSR
jgi:hypothetical protein